MTYLLQFWVFIEEHKNTNLEKYIHSMFTAAFFALASIQKEPAAAAAAAAKSLQSCPTLCDPIDSSPPGSPIPGILQARILEWVAIFFSNTPTIICQIFTLQKSQRGTSEIQLKLFTSYIFSHKSVFLLGTFCIKNFYICIYM